MLASQIPTKFPIPFGNNAATGTIRAVPSASQTAITPGAASLYDGFPSITGQPLASGGVPPSLQDFNGLLNQITAWNRWQNAGGTVTYDAAFSNSVGGYPAGAILASTTTGNLWLSTVDNNTSNPDGAAPSGWVSVLTPGSITNVYAKGSLVARRVFGASGVTTYTPTAGTNKLRVTVVGGGGSGSGVPITTSTQFAVGGGGGAGGVAISDIFSGFASVTMTIGAGGAPGSSAVGSNGVQTPGGNAGGTTSFGALLSATGGMGGTPTGAVTAPYSNAGGSGGTGSSGNVFNANGGAGANGVAFGTNNTSSGNGGQSYIGAGANGVFTNNQAGNAATTAGSGGSGACAIASGAGYRGGAGATGLIIVEEYS